MKVILYNGRRRHENTMIKVIAEGVGQVGMDNHVFASRPGGRLFDETGKEIARLEIYGWRAVEDNVPIGVFYGHLDIEEEK